MSAHVTPSPLLVPAIPSTSRSLLSRITSPLRSRSRNLTDFHIRPDDPHRKYSPGDTVTGAVVFTVVKPVRLTHLTVCLHGFVRVYKNANGANEPVPDPGLTASSNPRKSQYFGNGHASLFQDEQTLCGEGRLDIGVYEFNFELEFPKKGVPTSIDFERGTISYMITATVTRPTSIAATSSCGKKISLVETVDIGPLRPAKTRTISLEPISRKHRRRKTAKSKDGSQESSKDGAKEKSKEAPKVDIGVASSSTAGRMTASPHPDDSASQCGSIDQHATARSPGPSDVQSNVSVATSDSAVSSSTGLSFRLAAVPLGRSRRDSQNTNSKISLSDQTITAKIELHKSGALPGDSLPLKISIKHTKPIKSMHGIIITLYRQGRIDSAPPLSLFSDIKGKEAERLKHEEYYPKSKTGLAGLSLSSAGSSSMFRKDLAQTFAPILIDPTTLTMNINASVRVPEDAFPTISGVPGQMISFKYHVEVVIDLGGKLASQQRHIPRVGALSVSSGNRGDGVSNILTAYGGSIVDTENIRREKSVVTCLFEVLVGTTDSARIPNRVDNTPIRQVHEWPEESVSTPIHAPIYEEQQHPEGQQNGDQQYHQYTYGEEGYAGHYNGEYYGNEEYDYENYEQYPHPHQIQQHSIPPPQFDSEHALSEKERARLAEERLLPSQPPGETHPQAEASSSRTIGPSFPPVQLDEDIYSADDIITPHATSTTLPSHEHVPASESQTPSAPPREQVTPSNPLPHTDDKQELERRRLLQEANAPVFPSEEEDSGEGPSNSHQNMEPSAPADFGAIEGVSGDVGEIEELPKYVK